MKNEPLYLILTELDRNEFQVELRTNIDWLTSFKVECAGNGDLILHVPPPVMNVVKGTREECLLYIHKMFCAVPLEFQDYYPSDENQSDQAWRYLGDSTWAFCLHDTNPIVLEQDFD